MSGRQDVALRLFAGFYQSQVCERGDKVRHFLCHAIVRSACFLGDNPCDVFARVRSVALFEHGRGAIVHDVNVIAFAIDDNHIVRRPLDV